MSRKRRSYHTAEQRRQTILDFLNANPGAEMTEIRDWLVANGDRCVPSNTLRTMLDWREMRVDRDAPRHRYYALTATTRRADDILTAHQARLAAANESRRRESEPVQASASRACYRHKPGDRPIPNQGGQGASRARVYVSCMGFQP